MFYSTRGYALGHNLCAALHARAAPKYRRRCHVRVLKRRDKLDKTITIRVTDATKVELDQLRERADASGFDLAATLRESLTSTIRHIHSELDALEGANPIRTSDTVRNSIDQKVTTAGRRNAV